jgi:hypothetical protein
MRMSLVYLVDLAVGATCGSESTRELWPLLSPLWGVSMQKPTNCEGRKSILEIGMEPTPKLLLLPDLYCAEFCYQQAESKESGLGFHLFYLSPFLSAPGFSGVSSLG